MNILTQVRRSLHVGLVGCAITLLAGTTLADGINFRVAFASVPGIDEIEAGKYDAAIEILERDRSGPGSDSLPDVLTTLCAAYIVNRQLDEARPVCEAAVRAEESDAAFNNRGVLRAYTGDMDGAMRDFARVRVPSGEVNAYVEYLKQASPRLMATNNLETLRVARARKNGRADTSSLSMPGAGVEDLDR
jgi:hypothetical protein